MNVDTDSFRALTDQVAELAAQVDQLRGQALVVRSFDQLRLEALGWRDWTGAPRARHLRSVDGGAS